MGEDGSRGGVCRLIGIIMVAATALGVLLSLLFPWYNLTYNFNFSSTDDRYPLDIKFDIVIDFQWTGIEVTQLIDGDEQSKDFYGWKDDYWGDEKPKEVADVFISTLALLIAALGFNVILLLVLLLACIKANKWTRPLIVCSFMIFVMMGGTIGSFARLPGAMEKSFGSVDASLQTVETVAKKPLDCTGSENPCSQLIGAAKEVIDIAGNVLMKRDIVFGPLAFWGGVASLVGALNFVCLAF